MKNSIYVFATCDWFCTDGSHMSDPGLEIVFLSTGEGEDDTDVVPHRLVRESLPPLFPHIFLDRERVPRLLGRSARLHPLLRGIRRRTRQYLEIPVPLLPKWRRYAWVLLLGRRKLQTLLMSRCKRTYFQSGRVNYKRLADQIKYRK